MLYTIIRLSIEKVYVVEYQTSTWFDPFLSKRNVARIHIKAVFATFQEKLDKSWFFKEPIVKSDKDFPFSIFLAPPPQENS